jgi:hypothetical protein
MKKIALLFALLFALSLTSEMKAQANFQSAIGLRLGYPLALSYKFFISEPAAIELYLGIRSYSFYSEFVPGAMYLYHFPISGVDGLNWYVGGGASLYAFNYKNNYCPECGGLAFGINGAIGLDYTFADAPINLSVDWLPGIVIGADDFIGRGGFGASNGALAARYTLN